MATKAKTRYAVLVMERHMLDTSVALNAGELPQLEIPRARLGKMLDELQGLTAEQDALRARRQETTRRIQELLVQSGKVVHVIKTCLKEHYGHQSEKLVEFGIQPIRRRRRGKPAPEETASGESGTED
jgi:hypothetical protein